MDIYPKLCPDATPNKMKLKLEFDFGIGPTCNIFHQLKLNVPLFHIIQQEGIFSY